MVFPSSYEYLIHHQMIVYVSLNMLTIESRQLNNLWFILGSELNHTALKHWLKQAYYVGIKMYLLCNRVFLFHCHRNQTYLKNELWTRAIDKFVSVAKNHLVCKYRFTMM